MSHFLCAVITDGTKSVGELVAPYREVDIDDACDESLEFHDDTERYYEDYESSTIRFSFDPKHEYAPILIPPWGIRPMMTDSGGEPHASICEAPSGWVTTDIPANVVFGTFELFMSVMHPETEVSEYDGFGYWENPNAHWDWYTEIGSPCWEDSAVDVMPVRLGDIRFDAAANIRKARTAWEMHKGDFYFDTFVLRGMSLEQYLETEGCLNFWACVTPDGEWHEVARMGPFGLADVSADCYHDWLVRFSERFIAPFDPDCVLHVLDCHA